jgi:hypothetical protein
MLEEQFNEPALARSKMPMHTAAGQAMQDRDRLLRKKLFEFVRSHCTMADKTKS